MAMSGGVNSGTVYNMRGGRGYYPSRGGGGRGGRGEAISSKLFSVNLV